MFEMNWFLSMMKQGYAPGQIMINLLETQMKDSPMGENLLQLAKRGDTASIEQFARNYTSQRGVDFDAEFGAFRKRFGL